jgi:hypothetical protein
LLGFHGAFFDGFSIELLTFHGVTLDAFSLELLVFHGVSLDGFSLELLVFFDVFLTRVVGVSWCVLNGFKWCKSPKNSGNVFRHRGM